MSKQRKSRFVVDYDPYPEDKLDYLTQWDTPEKYEGNELFNEDGTLVPFEKYIRTYGNPDNYEVLQMERQEMCDMNEWHTVDILGGIDFYYTDNPSMLVGTYNSLDEIKEPFLRETAEEMLPTT